MMEDTKQRLIQIESGGRPLASYLSGEAISEILALISDCEQAAELRGRMDEVKRCVCKDNTFNYQEGAWEGVSKQKRLAQLQATKPEKGTEQ